MHTPFLHAVNCRILTFSSIFTTLLFLTLCPLSFAYSQTALSTTEEVSETDHYRSALKAKAEEIEALRDEKEELRGKLLELLEQNEALVARLESLENRTSVKEVTRFIPDDDSLEEIRLQKESLLKQVTEVRQEKVNLKLRLKKLERQLADRGAGSVPVAGNVQELNTEIENLQELSRRQKEEIAALKAQHSASDVTARESGEAMRQVLADAAAHIETLQQERNELQQRNEALTAQIDTNTEQLSQQASVKDTVEHALQEAQERHEEEKRILTSRIEALEEELNETSPAFYEIEIRAQEKVAEEQRETISRLEKAVEEARQQTEELQTRLDQTAADASTDQKQLAELKESFSQELADHKLASEREIRELTKKLESDEQSLAERLAQVRAPLQRQIDELTEQLNDEKRKLSFKDTMARDLKQEKDVLSSQLQSLQNDLLIQQARARELTEKISARPPLEEQISEVKEPLLAEIKELQTTNEELTSRLILLNEESEQKIAEVTEGFEAQLLELQSSIQAQEQTLQELQNQNSAFTTRQAQLAEQEERLRTLASDTQEQYKEEISALETEMAAQEQKWQEQMDEQTSMNDQLRTQIAQLQDSRQADLSEQTRQLEDETERLELALAEKDRASEELQQINLQQRQELQTLTRSRDLLQNQLQAREEELANRVAESATMDETESEQRDQELQEKEATLNRLTVEAQEMDAKLGSMEEEKVRLSQALEDAHSRIQQSDELLAVMKSDIQTAKREYEEKIAAMREDHREQMSQSTGMREQNDERVTSLTQELRALQAENNDYRTTIADLEAENQATETRLQETLASLQTLQERESTEAQQAESSLQTALAETRSELKKAREASKADAEKISRQAEQLTALETRNAALEENLARVSTAHESLQEEIAALHEEQRSLRRENEEYATTNQQLRSDLEAQQATSATLEDELASLREEKDRVRSTLESSLEEKESHWETLVQNLQKEIGELRQANATQKEQLSEVANSEGANDELLETLKSKNLALNEELTGVRQAMIQQDAELRMEINQIKEEQEVQLKDLQTRISQKDEELNALQEDNQRLKDQLAQAHVDQTSLNKQIQVLHKEAEGIETVIPKKIHEATQPLKEQVNRLESSNKQQQRQLEAQERELTQLTAERGLLQQKWHMAEGQLASYTRTIAQLESDIKSIPQVIEEPLKQEIKRLQNDLHRQMSDVNKKDAAIERLTRLNEITHDQLTKLSDLNKALHADLEIARTRVNSFDEQIRLAQEETAGPLQDTINDLKQALATTESRYLTELDQKQQEFRAALQEKEATLTELRESVASLTASNEQGQHIILQLREQMEHESLKMAVKENDLKAARERLLATEQVLKDSRAEFSARLTERDEEGQAQTEKLRQEMEQKITQQRDEYENEVFRLTRDMEQHQTNLDKKTQELAGLTEKMESMIPAQRLTEAKERLDVIGSELTALKSDLHDKENTIRKLSSENADLQDIVSGNPRRQTSTATSGPKSADPTASEEENITENLAALKASIRFLERRLLESETQVTEKEQIIARLDDQYKSLNRNLSTIVSEKSELEETVATLRERLDQTEKAMEHRLGAITAREPREEDTDL